MAQVEMHASEIGCLFLGGGLKNDSEKNCFEPEMCLVWTCTQAVHKLMCLRQEPTTYYKRYCSKNPWKVLPLTFPVTSQQDQGWDFTKT